MTQNYPHINDDLLVKYLVGETDADESAAVKNWLAADGDNQKYYDDFQKIWDESLQIAANNTTIDENAAWERMQDRIHKTPHDVPVRKIGNKRSGNWMQIAASFLIIGLLGYVAYTLMGDKVTNIEVQATNSTLTNTLPDGTVVTLNKNSLISYASEFEGKTRPVTLRGEAFFEVAHDKKKPFIVSIDDVKIKVVGTSFNVKNKNGMITIEVETGIVKVSKESETVELREGEKVIIKNQGPQLIKEFSRGKLYNYYRNNELVCDHTPLQELVDALNEIYDVNIVIKDPALQKKEINTTFINEPLSQVLNVISTTFRVKVVRKDNQIIIG